MLTVELSDGYQFELPIAVPDWCPECGSQMWGAPVVLTDAPFYTFFRVHRHCINNHLWQTEHREHPERIRVIRRVNGQVVSDRVENRGPEHRLPRRWMRRQGNLFSDGFREN